MFSLLIMEYSDSNFEEVELETADTADELLLQKKQNKGRKRKSYLQLHEHITTWFDDNVFSKVE